MNVLTISIENGKLKFVMPDEAIAVLDGNSQSGSIKKKRSPKKSTKKAQSEVEVESELELDPEAIQTLREACMDAATELIKNDKPKLKAIYLGVGVPSVTKCPDNKLVHLAKALSIEVEEETEV